MNETNPSTPETLEPQVAPATPPAPAKFMVVQRLLSDAGKTEMELPEGSEPLDVHLIDGHYYLRVLEPVQADESFDLTVLPVAVGQVIELTPRRYAALPVRHGGIHFLAYRG